MHWTAQDVAATAAVAAVIVAILSRWPGKFLWRLIRRTNDVANLLLGEPERKDRSGAVIKEAVPGVAARLATTDALPPIVQGLAKQMTVVRHDVSVLRGDMAKVMTQLTPNGGDAGSSSTYDQAKRAADAAERVAAAVENGKDTVPR